MEDIEQEARRAGPKAMADYAAAGATCRLARQVFDLRKAAKLTRRQLAARSGVRQADISRIEAGDANPTLATIAALAYALGAEVTLAVEHGKRSAEPRARARPHGARRTGVHVVPRRADSPR
jgi:transcriptional regulator with XRE-family HTH domain